MHPGPYNVLESSNDVTVENTIKELNWHGWLMDKLGAARTHYNPINTHIYTSQGDLYDLTGRFIRGFQKLDESVKSRLVVENNDKGGVWNCANLLIFNNLCKEYVGNIPLTYDVLHDRCLPSDGMTSEECFKEFYKTWGDIKPIFHFSESTEGNNKHAEYPTSLPMDYGMSVDWDVELKAKDLAIQHFKKL
jgi:UV DNA damage endonuclease